MLKRQQVIALLALKWSFRRIERETGVRRETISAYARMADSNPAKVFPGSEGVKESFEAGFGGSEASKPAKVFPGSESKPAKVFPRLHVPPRSSAAAYHEVIVEKLKAELTAQRIYQDLVAEYGYGHSYESVKRYVRKMPRPKRAVGVFHTLAGEEAQADFFQGAPTLDGRSGLWKRPWVFRMTLCHSRHGYEEAVWDQKLETFLGLHERAFQDLGGVPRVIRHDNLKAAVVRACLYDPDANDVYTAFARHYGFTALPTRPRNPQENGKEERSGGYVKDNGLKGHRFSSLAEQNEHLRHWNRTIARLRIHGTTRRQVYTHYLETDKPALQGLPREPFAFFQSGMRSVHPDGHVEVGASFYPTPHNLLGKDIRVRWDQRMVRLFEGDTLVGVFARVAPGLFAPRPGADPRETTSTQQAFAAKLLGRCERVGPSLHAWAKAAMEERGVRALRLIQGVLSLLRTHQKEHVLYAAGLALQHRLFRYRDLSRLASQAGSRTKPLTLLDADPSIRPMDQYRLEDLE